MCPLCVSPAILGMYTLMSNKQYYDALGCTGKIANTEGINSTYYTTRPLQTEPTWFDNLLSEQGIEQ